MICKKMAARHCRAAIFLRLAKAVIIRRQMASYTLFFRRIFSRIQPGATQYPSLRAVTLAWRAGPEGREASPPGDIGSKRHFTAIFMVCRNNILVPVDHGPNVAHLFSIPVFAIVFFPSFLFYLPAWFSSFFSNFFVNHCKHKTFFDV